MSDDLSIAENINTPAEQLVKLADTEDRKILAAIAKNPNTPIDLLIKLAGEYLNEIGLNPALELILVENPNFIADIYYEHFYYCEEDYEDYESISILLADWFVKLAASHHDRDIRIYIASNKHTSALYLEKLATDESDRVRANVAHHKNTPPSILEKLSQYEDVCGYVRGKVAGNINTPMYLLERLAKEQNTFIKEVRFVPGE